MEEVVVHLCLPGCSPSQCEYRVQTSWTVEHLLALIFERNQISDSVGFALFQGTEEKDLLLRSEGLISESLPAPDGEIFIRRRYFPVEKPTHSLLLALESVQLHRDVLKGLYPLTATHYLRLGALSLLAAIGPGRPPEQLAESMRSISHYIPNHLLVQDGGTQAWERPLAEEYRTLSAKAGPTPDPAAYRDELERMQPVLFGSSFFDAWELGIQEGFIACRTKVTVAISREAISILVPLGKGEHRLERTHLLREVTGWAADQTAMMFIFTLDSKHENRCILECEDADEMVILCNTYAQQLVEKDKLS
ncbi:hypothetical protein PAPYR_1136 [Paratrimastix pyriformis]|uniref:FERM domain-containing protein n=1 Tax=Paratrimastix pyriformis TaxID=342808 RepID=A0ABQ8UUG4_9EUKA|nr:hypothetical protein PAPYR_1136 [Paratrimastix pyriformis]